MKLLKYLLYLLIVLLAGGCFALKWISEDQPVGVGGAEADQLAHTIMNGLGKTAFDEIPYLQWEFFRGGHKYLWDKENNKAIIEWGDNKVIMDLDAQSASCYKKGVLQKDKAHEKLKQKAWSYWCNDSFWMIAPYKLLDPGTSREIVSLDDGGTGLMLTYESGGVTPGDSYLWILDSAKRPTGWKMWTSILPVQGLYTSWDGWQNFMGATLATKHEMAGREMSMKNVKAGSSWTDFGYTTNPFKT